jgi:hypothetical protein
MADPAAQKEKQQVESEAETYFLAESIGEAGSLAKTPVAAVLGDLWRRKATGGLLLKRSKVKKIVYLRQGNPYFVKSNLISECLGQILVKERLITKEECQDSLDAIRNTGGRQGEVLLDMKCINKGNLDFALELQFEHKLYDTFSWSGGDFKFSDKVDIPPMKDKDALPYSGATIVVEGVRRTFDEARLKQELETVMEQKVGIKDIPQPVYKAGYSERELQAIEAMLTLIPPHAPNQLLEVIPLDTVDNLRIIYTLLALGVLHGYAG